MTTPSTPHAAAEPIPPITGTVTVALPIEETFALFTAAFDSWWPRAFPIGATDVDAVVLEPFVGGRWYERGDVRFHAEGPAETTVAVEHRGFERLVGGQAVHDTVNGGGGWDLLLDTYAKSVA
jgi:hypothetical protein